MSYNFFHFNGDVRRDKRQEAMLHSLNERDNFLRKLQDMEKKREHDEKREKAVVKIQKLWRRYQTKQTSRQQFRESFDLLAEKNRSVDVILGMSQLLVNFYQSHKDEERLVVTLVELVKAKTANREFENGISDSQRLILARCCVKFLNNANENTIYFHLVRFLEEYIKNRPNIFDAACQIGLFEAEFHFFEALIETSKVIEKAPINQRTQKFLNIIFSPFSNSAGNTSTLVSLKTADRFLKTICVNVDDLVFTNYIIYYIKDHVRPNSPNVRTLLEAIKSADVNEWKTRPELIEAADARLRCVLLSQCEYLNKADGEIVKTFFNSLAAIMNPRIAKRQAVKEDLTEPGRIRTATIKFIKASSEEVINSSHFLKAACIYVNLPNIDTETIISLRAPFTQIIDVLAGSNSLIDSLFSLVSSHSIESYFEPGEVRSSKADALAIFCDCLNKRISSVADSDFNANDIFWNFDTAVEFLRDISLKLVNMMYPNFPRGDYFGTDQEKLKKSEIAWKDVTLSVFTLLRAIYQKDIRIKYFPEEFWTNHGRQALSVLSENISMPRRRPRGFQPQQPMRTVRLEFVERLARIYEVDSDSDPDSENEEEDRNFIPTALSRSILVMKNIPFIVPFMDRVELFHRLLERDQEKQFRHFVGGESHSLTVRRDQVYMDAFEQFTPKPHHDRVKELRGRIRVKMVNWVGMNESGVDGGGIFREFLSEVLKSAFNVDSGFFTMTEDSLLYPNPSAPFLLGADCLLHYQFIGRMIGKLIYEQQLQEVRFAEFFISQIFETDKNVDIDLQHMKSFDPLIFKHLKELQKLSDRELDELQLDFSVVTSDMGLVRNVNLKPNGSACRVTVENVHEYVRLYVNYYLKQRISAMVGAVRKGISEVISIEWMRMFAPHELQIMIAGYEEAFSAKEMRQYCELRFSSLDDRDEGYENLFWDVVDNLSPVDKKALLKFITGCSRTPVCGFKGFVPPMGVLVLKHSDDQLPTSATCMNLLNIPKYSSREKLEEKLRYAINSGAGFELN